MAARAALAWSLLAVLTPVAASCKCGTGNPPSYDDIDAVMFTQNGCKGTIQDADVSTLKGWFVTTFDCSTFWAFFRDNGLEESATYSQYNLKDAVGVSRLSVTLDDARALLSKDHFYNLNPDSLMMTDTARTVLSVKRCGVVTRVSAYNVRGLPVQQDLPTLSLFDDFRTLLAGARKDRISTAPRDFEETGLFDP